MYAADSFFPSFCIYSSPMSSFIVWTNTDKETDHLLKDRCDLLLLGSSLSLSEVANNANHIGLIVHTQEAEGDIDGELVPVLMQAKQIQTQAH